MERDTSARDGGLHPHRTAHRGDHHRHPRRDRHPDVPEASAPRPRKPAVKEDVHTIQVGVVSYAADHNGAYPATEYVTCTPSDKTADNLGNKYLDAWPNNPWTGKPMANTGSNVLFNTDFASMSAAQPRPGHLEVVNGQLVPTASGENRLAFGEPPGPTSSSPSTRRSTPGAGTACTSAPTARPTSPATASRSTPATAPRRSWCARSSTAPSPTRSPARDPDRVQRLRHPPRDDDQRHRQPHRRQGRWRHRARLPRQHVHQRERRTALLGRRLHRRLHQRPGARRRRGAGGSADPNDGRLRLRVRPAASRPTAWSAGCPAAAPGWCGRSSDAASAAQAAGSGRSPDPAVFRVRGRAALRRATLAV